ncbi:S1 family peptidase [Ktedonospora formicarum]|uniref:Trypsin-like serine protease n=1 Tax=Ktedonospora formicarum TaxID=2778364 RepID=A0A8J3I3N9_9CHLR|nr:serine protease [Ktedonospora formicarum]GHO44274.1 hypothetical protein KSX_24370 [Ktedonospora formicarum]
MKRRLPAQHTSLQPHRRLYTGLLVTMAVCALVFATLGTTRSAHAESQPGGNVSDPVVRAVDAAKPAVVRIITTLVSHVVVHFNSGDVNFPQRGNDGYIAQLSGSGTFISADGDILTADHVVNPPKDDSLNSYIEQQATEDIANYLKSQGKQTTSKEVEQQLANGTLKADVAIDQTESEVFLSTDYTGSLSATSFSSIPSYIHKTVDKIKQQSSLEQRDLAIIHAPFTDMPSIQLGDSSSVQQQDELTIIGFPGNGDVSNRPTDLLTSSVNKISVSSIKTTDNGAPVIQVGGNVEHGDSGGPALDQEGRVVGIVSFGLSSAASPGSTTFLQASNGASEMVKGLNINTAPGAFQKLWGQAINAYASKDAGHWHKAQSLFQQIQSNYPQFKAVQNYLDYTNKQASTETATTSTPGSQITGSPYFTSGIILAVVALIALVVLLFFVVSVRRRGAKQLQPAYAGFGSNPGQSGQARPFTQTLPNNPAQPFPPVPASPTPPPVTSNEYGDAMSAFGAPPQSSFSHPQHPPIQPHMATPPHSTPYPTASSSTTRIWPCGHANRFDALYCSVCGEPAPAIPEPPTVRRHVEQ